MTTPQAPPTVTLPGVELAATGSWNLSTGWATFTEQDWLDAVAASECPAVGKPVLKLGHVDSRFDGEPAIGHIENMRASANGVKLLGDYAGMPEWLGTMAKEAYPQRSIEGRWGFECQIGHVHPFVVTAVALLGVSMPGVGAIATLEDVQALYEVAAAAQAQQDKLVAAARAPGTPVTFPGGSVDRVMAAGVTTEDVRRAYFETPEAQANYGLWITEMQLDPPQLIVCDDMASKVYRVPITIKGTDVTFGDPVEVQIEYQDVAAAVAPLVAAALVAASGGPRTVAASWGEHDTSRAGYLEPPAAPPEPAPAPEPGQVEASGSHGVYDGTHSHPHAAMGAQGDDAMHEHSHTHSNDAVHNHVHAGASEAQPHQHEGVDMAFTAEQLAALRTRHSLPDDADEAAVIAAVMASQPAAAAGPPAPAAGGPAPTGTPELQQVAAGRALPQGVMLIDQSVWEDTQRQVQQGVLARQSQLRNERDTAIAAAIGDGKFGVARKPHWERLWDADPEGTKQVLATLRKGTVPLEDIGQAGHDEADAAFEDEFSELFPDTAKARR